MADEVKTEPTKKPTDNNKMILIVVAVVVGLFVLWKFVLSDNDSTLSNDKAAENFTESIVKSVTGQDVDYNAESGSVNISTDEGEFSSTVSEKLPDNFPSEVPVFDNQIIVSSYSSTNEGNTAWYVSAQTEASVEDVKDSFSNKFSDWKSVSTSTYNGIATQSYEMGDLHVTLIITPAGEGDNGRATITYSVTSDKE